MKLGVLLDNLGPNQLAYSIIKNANLVDKSKLDFVTFYENCTRPCLPTNFASMVLAEAYGYNGNLIATSVNNCHKMINFPATKNKFFYVWDLEWLRAKNKHFRYYSSIYFNPEIKLICRSISHKNIIEKCWNSKVVGIVDDFDIQSIFEVINNVGSK